MPPCFASLLARRAELREAAKRERHSVARAIATGLRTGDIYSPTDTAAKKVGTREMGEAIAGRV